MSEVRGHRLLVTLAHKAGGVTGSPQLLAETPQHFGLNMMAPYRVNFRK